MMNIVVFETETWAQTAWQRMKDDHEIRLLEKFLTSSNADEHADAIMISTDLSRLDAGILEKFENLIKIAGIVDSARFSSEDILNPTGWIMLAFIADPRTGLGYRRSFRISNFELMKKLPELLRSKTVQEILSLTDFQERIRVYHEETSKYRALLARHTRIDGDAIIINFQGIDEIPVGNRFLEYVLYPEQSISIRLVDGRNKEFAMISVGHSIINRASAVDVGSMVLKYGGGGHKQVGTCQVRYEEVDQIVGEMLQVINPQKAT